MGYVSAIKKLPMKLIIMLNSLPYMMQKQLFGHRQCQKNLILNSGSSINQKTFQKRKILNKSMYINLSIGFCYV